MSRPLSSLTVEELRTEALRLEGHVANAPCEEAQEWAERAFARVADEIERRGEPRPEL